MTFEFVADEPDHEQPEAGPSRVRWSAVARWGTDPDLVVVAYRDPDSPALFRQFSEEAKATLPVDIVSEATILQGAGSGRDREGPAVGRRIGCPD